MRFRLPTTCPPLWITLLLILAVPLTSHATLYPRTINFQHALDGQDIVLGEVRAIHQDSEGFMWFGSEKGFIRYDGYEFISADLLTTKQGEVISEPAPLIRAIGEDPEGRMWVAIANGIAILDRDQNKLTLIPDLPDKTKVSVNEFFSLSPLPNGKMVATSMNGLFIFDRETLAYEQLTPNNFSSNDVKLPSSQYTFSAIYDDDREVLWIGTSNGVNSFDWKTNTFKHFPPPKEVANFSKDQISAISLAEGGKLWLGTRKFGLYLFDPKTLAYKRYIHNDKNPNSLGSNDIWHLYTDSKKRLWVSTDQGGLNLYVPEKNHFIVYKNQAGNTNSLAANVTRVVHEDANNDIWIGLYPEGIDYFDQSTTAISSYKADPLNPQSLSHTAVSALSQDKDGNLWIGTDGGGLNFFNRETGKFISFKHDKEDPDSISSNAVISSFLDREGILWLGTWAGGVSRFDPKTNKFTRLKFQTPEGQPKKTKVLNSHAIWSTYEDRNGDLWFGTLDAGLSKYDRVTGEYTNYWSENDNPASISSNWIWSTFEDSMGNFWIATYAGLDLMDREKGTFKRFPVDKDNPKALANQALTVFEDSKKRIWVGTSAGLHLYHEKDQSFSRITIEDGLFNDNIRSILEDEEGKLWLSTSGGVSSYEPESKRIKNYYRDGGKLVGSFFYNTRAISSSGEIIFGGTNGLRIYKPKELKDNPRPPPVVFTSLNIFSENITPGGEDGILAKHINDTQSITLDYFQSMFVLNFSALNFREPDKNQYSYILEGFDEDWNKASGDRKAKYTNLDAGSYTFKVKGSNNDGIWNEEEKSLQIKVLPPPWETWWAYTLYFIAIISSILWFIHHQRAKRKMIEEQNRILEQKVQERTAELVQKNHDIQAMLSNIRQGLFTLESNSTIHPEYSSFLEKIFETSDIAGKNIMDLLFSKSKLGSNQINEVQESLFSIIGEDEMNFDFNQHLLVNEVKVTFTSGEKTLELAWNPIIVDDLVHKLMVTVRDVTLLRQMENEAQQKQRELDIISQLLNFKASKFLAFKKSAFTFIEENRETIENSPVKNEEALALLFRNMHTIKGNCRTFGFSFLSDLVHEVESIYTDLQKSEDATWDQDFLIKDLKRVEEGLNEYLRVYHEVLGRGTEGKTSREEGYWVTKDKFKQIHHCIEEISQGNISQEESQNTKLLLDQIASEKLPVILEDIVNSLPGIATQLGKPSPAIEFDTDNIRIKSGSNELITDVFSHIMRNSLDHGIETPEERQSVGKAEQGNIQVKTIIENGSLSIIVQDDGKGLNIDRLFEKGCEQGLWQKGDNVELDKIAELIFASGVSTKENISDISGRGVGMDAVKQFLKNNGCDIQLKLLAEKSPDSAFVPFATYITLPDKLFVTVAS